MNDLPIGTKVIFNSHESDVSDITRYNNQFAIIIEDTHRRHGIQYTIKFNDGYLLGVFPEEIKEFDLLQQIKYFQHQLREIGNKRDEMYKVEREIEDIIDDMIRSYIINNKILLTRKWKVWKVFEDCIIFESVVDRTRDDCDDWPELDIVVDVYPHRRFDLGEGIKIYGDDGDIRLSIELEHMKEWFKKLSFDINNDMIKECIEQRNEKIKELQESNKILSIFIGE